MNVRAVTEERTSQATCEITWPLADYAGRGVGFGSPPFRAVPPCVNPDRRPSGIRELAWAEGSRAGRVCPPNFSSWCLLHIEPIRARLFLGCSLIARGARCGVACSTGERRVCCCFSW